MIRIVLLTAVLATTALVSPSSAQVASEGPWCALRNFGSDLSEDCQYRTFEECRVTQIAGFRGFCNPNPRWVEPANQRPRRRG
ncbi:MAG TPA: DUF3551 domain-containing protein [Pseudolabrys sp.]|nr:DUF3551 domain-containing protein [Pseudolabrys sp.]